MKNKIDLSLFLGSCIISLGIIISAWIIAKELPNALKVPSNLSVTTSDMGNAQFGEYLSQYEVAAYLRITDEDVNVLIKSGELDGISTNLGTNYVFLKSKLDQWMKDRVK